MTPHFSKMRPYPCPSSSGQSLDFKMYGFPSLCVFTRTVLHERASVHDKRTTIHDNPVTQITTDKRGEEPASGRPRPPPSGGMRGPKSRTSTLPPILLLPRSSTMMSLLFCIHTLRKCHPRWQWAAADLAAWLMGNLFGLPLDLSLTSSGM
jgi:hypothetical protein